MTSAPPAEGRRTDVQGSFAATRGMCGMATPAFLLDLSNVSQATDGQASTDEIDLALNDPGNFCHPCNDGERTHVDDCDGFKCAAAGCSRKAEIDDNADTLEFVVDRDMKHYTQKSPKLTSLRLAALKPQSKHMCSNAAQMILTQFDLPRRNYINL